MNLVVLLPEVSVQKHDGGLLYLFELSLRVGGFVSVWVELESELAVGSSDLLVSRQVGESKPKHCVGVFD